MSWFIKRIGQAVFTLWAVTTFAFVLIRQMPSGPRERMATRLMRRNPSATAEQINAMVAQRIQVDPDESLHVAYIDYMTSLLQGDLGESIVMDATVAEVIARSLPWTAFVMSIAILGTFVIGLGLGAIMAYKEGSLFDVSSSMVAIFLSSVPYYVAAIVLIWAVAVHIDLFPLSQRYGTELEPGFSIAFIGSAIHHAILPAMSFIVTAWGGYALGMRGNSVQVLGEDFIRVARLRGIPDRRIALRYVGRNAILPMWTSFLITIGFMFGGSIILEYIFSYRGIGYYMFEAIEARDYPVMMGTFLVITFCVVVSILIADMTYGKLDPRVKSGDQNEAY